VKTLRNPDHDYDDMIAAQDEQVELEHRARQLARGTLSPDEAALCGDSTEDPFNPDILETVASLLYFHLTRARFLREHMEREEWGREYHAAHREREQAIANAHRHYRRLHSSPEGLVYIDPILAQLIGWVERQITPAPDVKLVQMACARPALTQWQCSKQEFAEYREACTRRAASALTKPKE
jgi:hypothetical protein